MARRQAAQDAPKTRGLNDVFPFDFLRLTSYLEVVRLRTLKRNWERLGRRDPFWAALTDPVKRETGWDPEQFYRSGAAEIEALLQQAQQLGISVSRRRALDFGCGAGRLTQALANHFDRCDGVDISKTTLRMARRHNQQPERCFYHLNVTSDLRLFADASFSFACSTLVLQHIEPRDSKRYLRDLLRVLAPGGLLVFQLPSHRIALERRDDAPQTEVSGPLPPAAAKARLTTKDAFLSVRAGEVLPLSVSVENSSPSLWPALPDAQGRYRINLANHWLDKDGELLQRDDGRCPLPHDVAPGRRIDVLLWVTAPLVNGDYWLELDLVQENVSWFAEQGSEVLRIPCRVEGGLPSADCGMRNAEQRARRGEVPPEAPFRERHPCIFRVLRVTRLRDVYWSYRRVLDRVKARRDRVIRRIVHPLINWWNRRPFAARMEMHCVPRAEVLDILVEGAGRLIKTEDEIMGGYHSCRYWVVKD